MGCGAGRRSAALTIYAAQGPQVTSPVVEAFERRHPGWQVDVIHGGTGEMLGRIQAERERPLGDVLWGGSLEAWTAHADLFAPLDLDETAFETTDPARKWHPFTRSVIFLVINTERAGAKPPASFRELTEARWRARGPIAFANPAVSGTGYSVVTALVTALGWDFVTELLRNAWLTDSSESMFKWVKDGETAAGFLFEMTLRDYLAAGAPLLPVFTEEGLITQTDGAGLIAGAPHPEAAAAFLRFLLGDEAQETMRAKGRRPARRGGPTPPGLLEIGGRPLIAPDPRWAVRDRGAILAGFEAARAKAGK